jgi:hypothetical protein
MLRNIFSYLFIPPLKSHRPTHVMKGERKGFGVGGFIYSNILHPITEQESRRWLRTSEMSCVCVTNGLTHTRDGVPPYLSLSVVSFPSSSSFSSARKKRKETKYIYLYIYIKRNFLFYDYFSAVGCVV